MRSNRSGGPWQWVVANFGAAPPVSGGRGWATPKKMSSPSIFRGGRGRGQPPIDDIETFWSPTEKAQAMRMLARSFVGSPETVRDGIAKLVAETDADELIVVSDVYDHALRLRSFKLIADAAGAVLSGQLGGSFQLKGDQP